jgi:hypothetical protein
MHSQVCQGGQGSQDGQGGQDRAFPVPLIVFNGIVFFCSDNRTLQWMDRTMIAQTFDLFKDTIFQICQDLQDLGFALITLLPWTNNVDPDIIEQHPNKSSAVPAVRTIRTNVGLPARTNLL